MTQLAKGWDYASDGIDDLKKRVTRARSTFDSGTAQRQKAADELADLVGLSAELRTYIDAQATANPGTEWESLKDRKDLLVTAFQDLKSSMDSRIAADDTAA